MSILVETVFGGFVSKVINDVGDITKENIKKVILDKKKQDLSTKVYRVIEKILNILTNNKYKNVDFLYDATENIFKDFKNNKNNIEAVRAGLIILVPDVSTSICRIFIEKFFDEICQDDYLFKRISLILQETDIKYNQGEFSQINKIIEKNHKEISGKLDDLANIFYENDLTPKKKIHTDAIFQNNKKQKYFEIWNSALFLHKYDREKPITLKDAFIMPDFKLVKSNGLVYCNTLIKIIDEFVQYKKTLTMLITGVPGIGKSTIISWMANKYIDNDKVIILRFRDWKRDALEKTLLHAICNKLECKEEDLEEKVLILDGFDEIKALEIRDKLLNEFFNDIKDFEKFKCIITSRPAYIDSSRFSNILELQTFDMDRIKSFCKIIKNIENMSEIKANLEVLGIPVILYMAIMSNVDISENPTKPELYNRIFAEKGGIFDKFFDGIVEYDNGSQILRNPENTTKYLEFLCGIAFKMFEKNELLLLEKEYEVPRLKAGNELISILEFPIKHLFESRYNYIEFIHKTIYEYFVSEYIYISINKNINMIASRKDIAKNIASVLGVLLKENTFPYEILEFLKYKVRNYKLNTQFNIINEAFQVMLQDGMTYYSNNVYKNIVDCEMNVFNNMLQILHLWNNYSIIFDNSVIKYIKYNHKFNLNLRKVSLRKMDLTEANLRRADLSNADLAGSKLIEGDLMDADLTRADLTEVNLIGANLSGANLTGAKLRKANLTGANLTSVKLIGSDLTEADLTEADLVTADLTDADLLKVNLVGANLTRANLTRVNLVEANLVGTNLSKVDLTDANLKDVNLTDANLRGIKLEGADLKGIKFYKSKRSNIR